jgi:hypothetical protein
MGELIDPARPLPEFALQDLAGAAFTQQDLRRAWSLVLVAERGCDAVCESNLIKMRQVRLTQGRHMGRIRGVLLLSQAEGLPELARLRAQHEGLQIVSGAPQQVASLLAGFQLGSDPREVFNRVYIVDPLGNLMMRYAPDFDPMLLKKDLERLLRLSHIG